MLSRVVGFGLLLAVVIAIPLSHTALSKKGKGPALKVPICHFPDDKEVGHVIVISGNAVPAHLEKHGDCLAFNTLDTGGCQCQTCQEQCLGTVEQCRVGCIGSDDEPMCLAECDRQLQICLANCDTGTGR